MRRHIVGTFLVVQVSGVTVAHLPGKPVLQVAAHIAVGILGDNQRCTGVMDEDMAQAHVDFRATQYGFDVAGNVDGCEAVAANIEPVLLDHDEVPGAPVLNVIPEDSQADALY